MAAIAADSTDISLAAGQERDPAPDAYRALALAAVVLGHWLLAVTYWTPSGDLHASNLLDIAPWTQWATWLLQPVPLFFVVGGWASSRSWRKELGRHSLTAAGRARIASQWRTARLDRLLLPVRTFVMTGLLVGLGLTWLVGHAGSRAARLIGMPLWFLAVYVPVTLMTPALVTAVRRWGWRVPMLSLGLVAVVDLLRFGAGLGFIGWANFAFMWTAMAALGVAAEMRPPRSGSGLVVAAGSLLLLACVVAAGWYPVSMVGVGDRSNNTPPTLALALLGVFHAGLACWAAPRLRTLLARRRVAARGVNALGAIGMHLYLWHLCGTVVVVAVQVLGVLNVRPLTGAWWATRPLWLACLAAAVAPVLVLVLRSDRKRLVAQIEHEAERRACASPGRGIAAAASATLALAAFALYGFATWWIAMPATLMLVWATGGQRRIARA